MELNVHGKQMDVGDSLRAHVTDKLSDLNQKYFNHAAYATVTFSREGHGNKETRTQISIQLGKNIMVIADATDSDAYASFETAATKLAKQMRRYKRKLRDHHDRQSALNTERGRKYVLAAVSEQDDVPTGTEEADFEKGEAPAVVAEMDVQIETMSVSDAVMRMDLAELPAYMFRNASNGRLNVVYHRKDGNISWVDPEQ